MLLVVCSLLTVLGVEYGDAAAGTVAFTAALDKDYEGVQGNPIVYNKVILNQGNGYNPATGVFTAPKGGFYVVNINGLTNLKKRFRLNLYHNNDYVVSAYARQTSDYDSAANLAVLKLKKGDRVYVKPDGKTNLFGEPDEIYGTFSAFQIGTLSE